MRKIDKYIGRLFHNMTRSLKSYEKSRGAERLHDLRVEIKRLKAIINLIKENQKNFRAHKHYKPLRDIFREAGDIRQPEVLFQLLLKHGVNDIKKDNLLDPDNKLVDDFLHHSPGFIKTCKKSKKELLKHATKINHKRVTKSIKSFEIRLRKLLTNGINIDRIHKTRKLIKQVIYLSDIYGEIKKKKRQFFDELQELIGVMHDKQILMILLRKATRVDHQKTLKDLKNALEADKKSIIERCNDFYKADNIHFV